MAFHGQLVLVVIVLIGTSTAKRRATYSVESTYTGVYNSTENSTETSGEDTDTKHITGIPEVPNTTDDSSISTPTTSRTRNDFETEVIENMNISPSVENQSVTISLSTTGSVSGGKIPNQFNFGTSNKPNLPRQIDSGTSETTPQKAPTTPNIKMETTTKTSTVAVIIPETITSYKLPKLPGSQGKYRRETGTIEPGATKPTQNNPTKKPTQRLVPNNSSKTKQVNNGLDINYVKNNFNSSRPTPPVSKQVIKNDDPVVSQSNPELTQVRPDQGLTESASYSPAHPVEHEQNAQNNTGTTTQDMETSSTLSTTVQNGITTLTLNQSSVAQNVTTFNATVKPTTPPKKKWRPFFSKGFKEKLVAVLGILGIIGCATYLFYSVTQLA